jgi:hypothetical protein
MHNRDWERAADEPLFFTKTQHTFDRSCQCKRCVRLHTITMQDRELLRTMGIAWTAQRHDHDDEKTLTPSTHATPKASEAQKPKTSSARTAAQKK